MAYKGLKQHVSHIEDLQHEQRPVEDEITGNFALMHRLIAAFFFALDRELEKVNAFFVYKRAEMERRLRILSEKYRSLTQPPSALYAGDDGDEEFSPDPAAEAGLLSSLLETKEQLHKILRYDRLNAEGFSKILKKYLKSSPIFITKN